MGKRTKTAKKERARVKSKLPTVWAWMVLAIILLFVAAIRVRLLSIPLERDEGEYAYAGQLILQGIPPYRMAYNMKLPGTYYAYALVMAIFGQSVAGIHLGLLLLNLGAIVLLFLIGRRLFDSSVGLFAAAAYGLMTTGQSTLGTQAHATHFVILPALGGILSAIKAAESRRLNGVLWSGVLLGIAFTMKQQAAFLVLFALLYLVWVDLRQRPIRPASITARATLFAGSAALPFLGVCIVMYAAGVFDRFWFWAIQYARQYVSVIPLKLGAKIFFQSIKAMIIPNYMLWILAALGLALVWIDAKSRRHGVFATGFFIFGFLTICPGFYFRPHYYVTWMPALALLIGVAVSAGRNLLQSSPSFQSLAHAPAVVFLIALLVALNAQAEFLFSAPVSTASRMMYGDSPWSETQEIAKYIRERTTPADTIAVVGSEPQIYFYSDRKSATGYIYTYPLMEPQQFARQMQIEMKNEIESMQPKYVVFVAMSQSWARRPASDATIIDWATAYCKSHYNLAGFVQTRLGERRTYSDYHTDYVWGDEVNSRKPDPRHECLYVFVRK